MPADPLGVAGQLGEQMAVPQDHRVAKLVGDDVDAEDPQRDPPSRLQ